MLPVLATVASVFIFIQCALAQATATIHPVGVNGDASLQGQVVGTGGSIGTTYLLTGVTDGIPFTMTYAEGSGKIAEGFDIPSLSLAVHAGCTFSGSQAQCLEIVSGASEATTLTVPVTLTPVEVLVSTVLTTLPSRSATSTGSSSDTRSTILPSSTSGSPTSTAANLSSAIQHGFSASGLFFCSLLAVASWYFV